MARTTTLPQAAKPRHDDLDTFGRRDGSVSNRNAAYNGKDPSCIPIPLRAERTIGWDTALIDNELELFLFDEEGWDLFDEKGLNDEEEIDPDDLVDHGAYGTLRGAQVIMPGFGPDAIFGEGYLSGNCGFSVRDRP